MFFADSEITTHGLLESVKIILHQSKLSTQFHFQNMCLSMSYGIIHGSLWELYRPYLSISIVINQATDTGKAAAMSVVYCRCVDFD